MMKIPYVFVILLILVPNLSLAFHDETSNTHTLSLERDPIIRLRDSMLIDIEDVEYDNSIIRVMIMGNVAKINDLNGLARVAYQYSNGENFIAIASTTEDNIPFLKAKGLKIVRDQPLDFLSDDVRDISRLTSITRASLALEQGFSGKNVTIAIVDTGTDFSNEDMRDALARDEENKPIMLDADAQGIVLTTTKFIAKFVNDEIVNHTISSNDPYTSYVYVNEDGVFLRATGENKTKFNIYNPLYPFLPILTFNATTDKDWKIGDNSREFIRSASGIYKMGFIIEPNFHLGRFGLIIVPVLVVDSKEPNVYDTIIADMSDAWKDFAIFELGKEDLTFDFDFTDEAHRRIGDNNEMLLYDADNDNSIDLTAGVLGAYVVDLWGVINATSNVDLSNDFINATLLEPMDSNGNYFGIMYDFFGHGTATASTIVSKGINEYDVYNNGTKYKIEGIARDAKIMPIKALWVGDTIYAWLWASGLDLVNGTWKYNGKHKADIINNSWGIPVFILTEYMPGYDPISMLADILSMPRSLSSDYPGVLMVSSAGNSGYGHGTVSIPASSALSLTVGATTNNVFVGYGFTKNEPRFGNSTYFYNDIAEFSSKGPLSNGYVKPDIVTIGAYGFVPMLVNLKHVDSEPIWLFGGTSMAAPIVSGAAAIVMQMLKERGEEINPQLVKSILVSSANDINNEPFTQGSGSLGLSNTFRYLNSEDGSFLVYTNDTVNLLDYKTYTKLNFTLYNNLISSNYYAGFIERDGSKEARFYIHNPSDSILNLSIKGETLKLIKRMVINGTTEVRKYDPILNDTGGFAPNYIRLNSSDIPKSTDLMILKLRFPFETFMNTTDIYAHSLRISSLYLYEWEDLNNDDEITFNEIRLVNRGGAYGTIQEVSMNEPLNRITGKMVVGVYPVPQIVSFWTGIRNINATSMNYTLTIDFYKKSDWDVIKPSDTNLLVKPNSTKEFRITINTHGMPYGIHQGYLTLASSKIASKVPISFAIPLKIEKKDIPYVITNNASSSVFYESTSLIGSFDMSSRFNSGEWRFYHLNITNPSINTVSAKVIWENDFTSIHIFAVDPAGKIIASSVPAGVFQTFINWATNDWLGGGALGSGAFYPAANLGNNTTTLYIPINGSGIYTLALHNTLFHAKDLTEPFRIELKASTILADIDTPLISFEMPEYVRGIITIPINVSEPNIEDLRYSIDGIDMVITNSSITINTNEIENGYHTLEIHAKDTVGNSMVKSHRFIVDNQAPIINTNLSSKIYSGIIDIKIDIVEPNLANFTVILPDKSIVSKDIRFNTSQIADGEYKIIINALDLAGNNSTLISNIEIDNTKPIVSIDTPKKRDLVGVIDILYNATDKNLSSVVLLIDGLPINVDGSGIYRLDTASLIDGEHEIAIVAEDLVGNRGLDSIKITSINQEVRERNVRDTSIIIGIAIGSGVTAAILLAYKRKR